MNLPTIPQKFLVELAVAWLALMAAFVWGWHLRGNEVARATVKQVVAVAKIETKQADQVDRQNEGDHEKIADLERRLADALARPDRVVRVRDPRGCVPEAKADAGTGVQASPETGPTPADAGPTRAQLLEFAADAERARLAWASCQAQWPR